jgi:hypothetical protein
MQKASQQAHALPYDALLMEAKGSGMRRLETTVLRFPSVNSDYAVCSATLETADGATYSEVACAAATSTSGDAQAKALELACQKAKSKALESFTGIKCEVKTVLSVLSPQPSLKAGATPAESSRVPAPLVLPTGPCYECGAELSPGNHEFSTKLFKRPLCVPCQINAAASR